MILSLSAFVACSSSPGGGDDDDDDDDDTELPQPDADVPVNPADEPATLDGCDGQKLYQMPGDASKPGPWPVGTRTVQVGRLTVEVWYPAVWNSEEGAAPELYDIRKQLPLSQQAIIPDADNTWQQCDCYRDLPMDTERGPFPVIVFQHGTAAFRTESLTHMTHWASRGFVVAAADHPGLRLADSLALLCPDSSSGSQNLSGDFDATVAALTEQNGQLAFLAGNIDMTRVGAVGHSAGGNAVSGYSSKPGVRVVIPLAAGGTTAASSTLESTLYLGGKADSVVSYSNVRSGYEASASPKRLVGISNTGHLVMSDLCELRNSAGKDMVEVATEHGICGLQLASFLFDCDPTYLDPEVGWDIVNFATTAVLQDVLHCSGAAAQLDDITTVFPDVTEYEKSP